MNKLIVLTLVFFPILLFSQSKSYNLVIGQILQKYDIQTENVTGVKSLIKSSYKFTVVSKKGSDYIIWLLKFSNGDPNNPSFDGLPRNVLDAELYADTNQQPIYFLVPGDIWDQYAQEVFEKSGFTFGIVNVPMKIRFSNTNPDKPKRLLELESNVNLGLSAAYYVRGKNDNMFFWSIGITLTQISANATNTNGFLKGSENRAGFGLFTGPIYQKDRYQIGLLFGLDFATGDISDHWVYQGQPWLGIGIGLGIFQPNNIPAKTNK